MQLCAPGNKAAFVAQCGHRNAAWSQVRLQLQTLVYGADKSVHLPPKYRGPFQTVVKIIEEEGVRAPFKGLSPGLHRQVLGRELGRVKRSAVSCWCLRLSVTYMRYIR